MFHKWHSVFVILVTFFFKTWVAGSFSVFKVLLWSSQGVVFAGPCGCM